MTWNALSKGCQTNPVPRTRSGSQGFSQARSVKPVAAAAAGLVLVVKPVVVQMVAAAGQVTTIGKMTTRCGRGDKWWWPEFKQLWRKWGCISTSCACFLPPIAMPNGATNSHAQWVPSLVLPLDSLACQEPSSLDRTAPQARPDPQAVYLTSLL